MLHIQNSPKYIQKDAYPVKFNTLMFNVWGASYPGYKLLLFGKAVDNKISDIQILLGFITDCCYDKAIYFDNLSSNYSWKKQEGLARLCNCVVFMHAHYIIKNTKYYIIKKLKLKKILTNWNTGQMLLLLAIQTNCPGKTATESSQPS